MANKRDVRIKKRKPVGRLGNAPEMDGGEQDNGGLHVLPPRKKRRRGRSAIRLVVRLVVVAVFVAGIFLVYKNWDAIAPESLVIWMEEKLSGGQKGDGFPVAVAGSEVLDMAETQDGLALLTDTAYVVYNANGGEVFRRPHGYSSPILKTAGKYALIAEAEGTRLRLETRSSTAAELTMENKIISAAVGKNGSFAVATESSQGYTTEIIVYTSKKKELFHWYGLDLTILDVALSPDGKYLAAVGVTADAGAMRSSVLVFDMGKTEPVVRVDDTDILLCAVGFFSNGAVAAVGDTGIWVVSENGSIQQKQGYDGKELVGFAVGEKNATVVLRDYGKTEGGDLLAVNPNGDAAYSIPYEGAYRNIAPSDSGAVLLTSDHLYTTGAGGLEETKTAPRDGRMVCPLGHKEIVLGLTTLSEVK